MRSDTVLYMQESAILFEYRCHPIRHAELRCDFSKLLVVEGVNLEMMHPGALQDSLDDLAIWGTHLNHTTALEEHGFTLLLEPVPELIGTL